MAEVGRVTGAGGAGAPCNGEYVADGTYGGRTKYQQRGGRSIMYYDQGWKIHVKDDVGDWYYAHDASSRTPPAGQWTTTGYDGQDAEPPPTITTTGYDGQDAEPPPTTTLPKAAQQVQEKTAQVAHDAGEKLKGLSPASTTSTISTAASSTADAFHKAEQKVEEIPQGAQRSCGDTFRNHYSGRIDLLAWHKDEMTLAKEAGVSLVQSGVDSLSTAGTTASDNVAPWFQSGQKAFKGGDKDCVHNTRHCECSLGDAFGRIFHKTESVAGQAGQSVKGAAQQAGQAVKGAADQAGQAVKGAVQ